MVEPREEGHRGCKLIILEHKENQTMKTIAMGCAVVGASLFICSQPALAGNLVLNGGFDDFNLSEGARGEQTNWNYFEGEYLETHQSELGWQVTNGSTLEVRKNGVAGTAHNGSGYFAELDAHKYGGNVSADADLGLFQDIVTKIGKKYRFEFSYAARPGVDGDRNQFETLFGDSFSQQFDGGNGKTADGKTWKTFSTEVVATSDLTRLQFNYLGQRDTLGAHVDTVSVESVPEPASLLGLAFLGLFGAGSIAKRNKLAAE